MKKNIMEYCWQQHCRRRHNRCNSTGSRTGRYGKLTETANVTDDVNTANSTE